MKTFDASTSGAITNSYITWPNAGTGTVGTTVNMGYCSQCMSWYYGSFHTCHHAHVCNPEGHNFIQARSPYEGVLFCGHCGESKPLKKARAK